MNNLKIVQASQGPIHKFEYLKRKLYHCNPNLFFNKQCLQKQLILNCARVKIPNTSPAAKFTQRKAQNLRIQDELKYVEIKRSTRCNRLVSLLQNLLFAQHVSGTIMPIIRSSRVIQMIAACGTWRFGLQVVGLVWSCGLCVRFAGCCICITLELLMMGIMVPETCWANNKFCNKETNLLHLVGLLISTY